MEGIFTWYHNQIVEKQHKMKPKQLVNCLTKHKQAFKMLIDISEISLVDKPFTRFENEGHYDELCLSNPYSRITCFILQLYSFEFGTPPFYAEVNRVARDRDMGQLVNLGPYRRALNFITYYAENNKRMDKIRTGQQIQENRKQGVKNNFAGAFLLWRGAQMKEEWIRPYEECITFNMKPGRFGMPMGIFLPGGTSCSQCLRTALDFATKDPEDGRQSVLFVISC